MRKLEITLTEEQYQHILVERDTIDLGKERGNSIKFRSWKHIEKS
jgi:hypothetical protein